MHADERARDAQRAALEEAARRFSLATHRSERKGIHYNGARQEARVPRLSYNQGHREPLEMQIPYPARVSALLGRAVVFALATMAAADSACASLYPLPADGSVVVGKDSNVTTVYEDTLPDIAHRFSLGYYEIIRANPDVDVWVPGAGHRLTLPGRHILPAGPREGIVVNLPEHRLYYFPKPRPHEKPIVITYPVSIGKMDWRTPLGETRVIAKIVHPAWYPPESIRKEHEENGDPLPRMVGPGPNNPLGDYALRLAAGRGEYMIHGTNKPVAVGMAVTHGCIRMYPEDVAALFAVIPVGTKVRLVNEPVKVAWVDGRLFLEAHPPVDEEGQSVAPDVRQLSQKLKHALGDNTAAVHWELARATLKAANGMPTLVGLAAEPDKLQSAATVSAQAR
jgi:L,D-transpeptidase ErfK/SrfK